MIYTEDQRKEFNKGFFSFTDGKTVNLKVENVSEQRFSDGKWELLLNITDADTGEKWEKVRYQFDFANALDKLPVELTPDTVIEVQPKITGTKPNSKNPDRPYDVWSFIINVVGKEQSSDEKKMKEIFGKAA